MNITQKTLRLLVGFLPRLLRLLESKQGSVFLFDVRPLNLENRQTPEHYFSLRHRTSGPEGVVLKFWVLGTQSLQGI